MHRIKTPLAAVLLAGAAAILAPNATAITLKRHVVIPHGVTRQDDLHRVVVTKVAPPDQDDDGYADSEDNCPSEPYSGNGGCKPEPVAAVVSESVAPAPVSTSVAGLPDCTWAPESGGSYSAYNASSGAGGRYQIIPSTWAAYGGTGSPESASPAEQDAIASAIYADVGGSAWVNC